MSDILITGCAGFIGSHLVRRFIELGYNVIGIDNLCRKGTEVSLAWLSSYQSTNFKFRKIDVRCFDQLCALFKSEGPFDLIIHEAAQVAVSASVIDPRLDFETNALGTFNMLEATRLYSPDAIFEFPSTNKVYGSLADLKIELQDLRYICRDLPQGVSEDMPLDFHSPYGCSKGTADQYVRDYHRIYGLKTIILRQSCIYGTRQFGVVDQGWVAWFIIASLLGKKTTIFGDGRQVRDLLWIDDLLEICDLIYQKGNEIAGEVFNIGGGIQNTLSLLELIQMLQAEGIAVDEPHFAEWRQGDQKVYMSDIAKIKSKTGWHPEITPSMGVSRLIDWAKCEIDLLSGLFAA